MNYLVSIVIPMYNSEKYIRRCIDSVLCQTYRNIEVIVVDDGSKDNSLNIVREYDDNRIKAYKKENAGVSSARNYGIEKSNGEYLLFVDSDDYIASRMVELLIEQVNNISTLVFCDNDELWKNRVDKRTLFEEKEIKLDKNKVLREIASGRAGLVCSKLVSSKVIKENNIVFDKKLKVGEDQIFFLELAEHTKDFKYVNKSLYYYDRTNENSATIKYQYDLYENFSYLQEKVSNLFKRNDMVTEYDINILSNKQIVATWVCINNEVNAIKNIGIQKVIKNIENILIKSENKFKDSNKQESKINNLVIRSSKAKNKKIASLKLIIIINIFNLKMKLRSRG